MCLFIRALSFNSKEVRCSPKRRSDGHVSRTSSMDSEQQGGEMESKKVAEENKENMGLDEYYSDQDSWNESVISGTHHRLLRDETCIEISINNVFDLLIINSYWEIVSFKDNTRRQKKYHQTSVESFNVYYRKRFLAKRMMV